MIPHSSACRHRAKRQMTQNPGQKCRRLAAILTKITYRCVTNSSVLGRKSYTFVTFRLQKCAKLNKKQRKAPVSRMRHGRLLFLLFRLYFYLFAAFTIAVNLSVLSDAPPIRPPSTLCFARRSSAFASFIEPPY